MSFGNNPDDPRLPDRGEPPAFDCAHCDGQTLDPSGVCPDCAIERRRER